MLRVAYGEFYPYSFTDDDGGAQGYNIDVTRYLAEQAGYEVEFVLAASPKQFLAMLARNEVDVTPLLALTPSRRAAGRATTALGEYRLSVFLRRDSAIDSIEALLGRRIGVAAGSITSAVAAQLPGVEIVEYETSDAMLLPLLSGTVDAVVGVADTFEAGLRLNFIEDKVRRLEPALEILPYGLIVRTGLPQVHAALEAVIATGVTPKTLAPLRAQWFGRNRSILEHPWFPNVAMIVGGLSMAGISLAVYAMRLRRKSAVLLATNGANQLLIDALDKIRGAIAIFDENMNAVHWNSGFEDRFGQMVPILKRGATVCKLFLHAYETGVFVSDMDQTQIRNYVCDMQTALRAGGTTQAMVQTHEGCTFDLSLFPLGPRYHAAIWVDVSELSRQQARISSQSDELARKNNQLEAFSAMAAHDLKAPLVQQAALIEFIIEDIAGAQLRLPGDVEQYFNTLVDLSRRMNHLVCDLLDYAKSDMGQTAPECFDPTQHLQEVLHLATIPTEMSVEIMPDMPQIRVDPTSFEMVMRNLLSNAVKHHDRQSGQISVRAHRIDNQVVFEVEDDGPGIPQAQHAMVFEPFLRLTRVEGTGLGLAMVKKTAQAWGGEISVRSAPVRGCIFAVSVPAVMDNVVPLAPTQSSAQDCEETVLIKAKNQS